MADTLTVLRNGNLARHIEWTGGAALPLSFRGVELSGEAGEAANVIKKIERVRLGIARQGEDVAALIEHLATELADVIISSDLIAMDLGIDLGKAVRAKFNATSRKNGLTTTVED